MDFWSISIDSCISVLSVAHFDEPNDSDGFVVVVSFFSNWSFLLADFIQFDIFGIDLLDGWFTNRIFPLRFICRGWFDCIICG